MSVSTKSFKMTLLFTIINRVTCLNNPLIIEDVMILYLLCSGLIKVVVGHGEEALDSARPPGGEELCDSHPRGIPMARQLVRRRRPSSTTHGAVILESMFARSFERERERNGFWDEELKLKK